MCIYHEAVRLDGVRPSEALALAVLPGYEKKHPFLQGFADRRVKASDPWQVATLVQLAALADDLLPKLLALPEDQGNGSKALEILQQALTPGRAHAPSRGSSGQLTVYHKALELPGLSKEVVLALGALPGYEIRKSCLTWYAENPGDSATWQVSALDRIAAATCVSNGLSDRVRLLPATADGAAQAVALVKQALGDTGETPRRASCCGG